MWSRSVAGKVLTFYLAGINNENFLMRDRETGSFWQQVTGRAISGPLKGSQLQLEPIDELTFGLWKREAPHGLVLAPVPQFLASYAQKDWERQIATEPVAAGLSAGPLPPRETIIGVESQSTARAFPVSTILAQSVLHDSVGNLPIVLIVGSDHRSIRVFLNRLPGTTNATQFFESPTATWSLLDAQSGSYWNFEGCGISGDFAGKCLSRISYLEDFWFDWKHYHPQTSVYLRSR